MAMDFPASPSVGQVFTIDGKQWIWDGTSWNARMPNTTFMAHSGTHGDGGVDEITIAPSQVTGTAIVLGDSHIVTFCTSTTRPSTPVEGQIIYETNTDKYFGWKGSEWSAIGGGASYSSSAPANAQLGDLWIDSDAAAAPLNENDFKLKADAILDQRYSLLQATMGVM
jgi:hypothetical protein